MQQYVLFSFIMTDTKFLIKLKLKKIIKNEKI